MLKHSSRHLARLAGATVFALAGIPAQAQWNLYGNGQSFTVPLYNLPNPTSADPRYVSLTLSGIQNHYLLDTGSLGLVAGTNNYSSAGDPQIGSGYILYNTSGVNPQGNIYLTNVTINGANGQTATARIPVLNSTTTPGTAQLGVGFDRGGIQQWSGAPIPYNLNLFLGLTAINGQPIGNMQPGYIIDFKNQAVTLGLNQQNTSGFSFVQLLPNGGLQLGCSAPGMNCPFNWGSQTASIKIDNTSLGPMSVLPDSGIGYMLIQAAGTPSVTAGTKVYIYLPGQTQPVATYQFAAGDGGAGTPTFVSVDVPVNPPFANLGRAFFENLTYLYDPINGFAGYMPSGVNGTTVTVAPLLALQGNLSLPSGFLSSFSTYLMGTTALTQTGSGTINGSIFGPGGLTLQSGNLTLGGQNSYAGGTIVNGGTLTVANTGSITGLLTVNPGASVVNNGTVNAPGLWQLNQGSLTNTGNFIGNLANTGTTTNTGGFTGSLINGNSGWFINNGTVTGGVLNMGLLSGNGTFVGSVSNSGVIAPGNSVGTITVTGNYAQAPSGVYATEVFGSGLSDRINVGGNASLGGTVLVSVVPGLPLAPSTTYTILNAQGGLNGTAFAGVNELYPFLQSSLSYDTNNAYLTLQVGGFAAQALNNTQYAVGAVLDANAPNATGDFATVLGTLAAATAQQGQAFMTAASGNNYAGFSTSMVQGAQLFMNNFANQTGGGGSPVSNRVALAEACDVACDATTPPKWGAWGGALGGLGTIGANQPVGSVTYNAGGFAAGLDRSITDSFRMGLTAGYTTGTQWVSGFDGLGRSNTFQVGLYGGFAQDKVYADGLIGYAYTSNQMWRNIPVPGLQPRTAYGQTGANQWYGQIETGYRFDLGTNANAFVTPVARLQAYTANQNAFTETGAQSLNLSVAQQQTNSLRSVIGAQLGGSMDLGWREKLAMQLRLGWSHEYADVGRPVTATLAGAPAMPFTTFGVAPQRDGVVLGLSANTAIAEATSIYLRYEGDISGQDSAHAITAGVRMTW